MGIHSFIHPLLDLLKSTTTKTNKDLLRLWVGGNKIYKVLIIFKT